MVRSFKEQLSKAISLFKDREYTKAHDILTSIDTDQLSDAETYDYLQLECKIQTKLGDIENSVRLAGEVLESATRRNAPELIADALILQAEAFWRSGRLDEALDSIEKLESLLTKSMLDESQHRMGAMLRHKGIIHWYKGEYQKAIENHSQSLEIYTQLGDRLSAAKSINNLGLVYWSKGDIDKAIEHYEHCLQISQELDDKYQLSNIYNNLGTAHTMKGDLDKSLEFFELSLELTEELGRKRDIAMALTNMGAVYQSKGYLTQSLALYYQSLDLYAELGNRHETALTLMNIGTAYEGKGELSEALNYNLQSLEIKEELGNQQDIALSMINIGQIYQRRGEFDRARESYGKALSLYEEIGNDQYTSITLFHSIDLAVFNDDTQTATEYLTRLQEISEKCDQRFISQHYRMAKALILKSRKQARDMLEAKELLEQIIEEQVINHQLTVYAMTQLCHLLLFELRMTENEKLLVRAKELSNQLLEIAKRESSYALLTESYLLQSKFALLDLDIEHAKLLLAQAHVTAEEKGLLLLVKTIENEREKLNSEMKKWISVIDQNPTKQEMIDLSGLDNLLERMIRKTVTVLSEETKSKYKLVHKDLLKDSQKAEQSRFRVGIAQIGLSEKGDIVHENYEECSKGLFGIREKKLDSLRKQVEDLIERAHKEDIKVLLFPELTIDLRYEQLNEDLNALSQKYGMHIIPGSFHDIDSKKNISQVIGPEGVLWKQEKHIPAIIHYKGERILEGTEVSETTRETIVCSTEYGRMAITTCRDFLDMDLRVELKNSEPPVDLLFNPAFTPVTADFKAAHFDARRSIYAYCFFANVAEFGNSQIFSPEKDRDEIGLPAGEEGLIFKDVDLFQLRAERKKWEKQRRKQRPFIQSTR